MNRFRVTITLIEKDQPQPSFISYSGNDLQKLYQEARQRLLDGWLEEDVNTNIKEISMKIEEIA